MKFNEYKKILQKAMFDTELDVNDTAIDRIKNTLDFSDLFGDKQRDNPDDLDYVTGVIQAFVAIIAEETRDSQVDPDSDTLLVWLHDAVAGLEGSAEEETAPPDVRGVPIPGYIPYVDMDDEQQDLVRSMGEWSSEAPVAIFGIQDTYATIKNTGLPNLMAALNSAEALAHHTNQAAIVRKGGQPVTVVQAPQNGGETAFVSRYSPGDEVTLNMDTYKIVEGWNNPDEWQVEFYQDNNEYYRSKAPLKKLKKMMEEQGLDFDATIRYHTPVRYTFRLGNLQEYKKTGSWGKAGELKDPNWYSSYWHDPVSIERIDE